MILPSRHLNAFVGAARGRLQLWALGVAAVLATGCDPQRIAQLEEGVATEADVKREFGEPEAVWDETVNGAAMRVLEYNRQPQGVKNYHIHIGGDGKMTALRQLLTPQNFARITPGMPMEAVRKSLGRPAQVKTYALANETHYTWRWQAADEREPKMFHVICGPMLKVLRTETGPDTGSQDHKGG